MTRPRVVADTDALLERVGGNRRLLSEVIRLFVEECPHMIGRMRAALDDGDSRALNRAAHAFKGSAANFAADAVVYLAQQLETDAANGDFTTLTGLFHGLEAETEYMLADLSASEVLARCES